MGVRMRVSWALWLCAACVGASDVLFCVVTSRRPKSYLSGLVDGLKTEGAGRTMVVDVDNSTLPGVGAVPLSDANGGSQACVEGAAVPCETQKQGVDIVRGLEQCVRGSPVDYVAFVEDDMAPCAGSLATVRHVVLQLEGTGFRTARFAKFSRAMVLPVRNVGLYAAYVKRHVHERPHDILLNDAWVGGEDYVHPVSLFTHAGRVSTIEWRNDPAYIATYSGMRDESCGTPLWKR